MVVRISILPASERINEFQEFFSKLVNKKINKNYSLFIYRLKSLKNSNQLL